MKKITIYIAFCSCLFIVLILLLLGKIGWLGWVGNSVGRVFSPVEGMIFSTAQKVLPTSREIASLKAENLLLRSELVKEKELQQDNQALRDQFTTTSLQPTALLPAHIIAAPNFLPNITYPDTFVLDIGYLDNVKKGMAVVYKDNLIGVVTQATSHTTQVMLIAKKQTIISAKNLETNALGVIKGQGSGDMTMENVLLSDTLHVGNTIVTNQGMYPPNLVIGKITSVDKNPSALFQQASVKGLVDFEKLTIVFVLIHQQ